MSARPLRTRTLLALAGMVVVATAAVVPAVAPATAGAAHRARSTTTTTAATPPGPVSGTILLTASSDGTTVTAIPGDLVLVHLAGGSLRWSEARRAPSASSVPVLQLVSASIGSDGSSTTEFRVVGHGRAELEATATALCGAALACPQFVLLWDATVLVPEVVPVTAATG